MCFFFFSSRRRHTRSKRDWSSDVCSSDLKGYVARNTLEVRVDDVARVGELLEAVVTQGATSVSGLRFDVKDRAKLEREAVRTAVSNARAKAEAAAAGAGRSVDRLVRIDESGGPAPGPVPMPQFRALTAQA